MPRLTDEQKRVVEHDDGNILVTASAGSGKTHTMIQRVIRLVTEGKASVKEILAVTFTEMAALEMKDKLKSALQDVAEENCGLIAEQINDVATADISTLHSFCGKLIRTYFFKVGLSPDFKICDQTQSDILKNESIDLTFKHFYDLGEEWFYTLVDRYARGRMDGALKELVLKAHEFCSSEADPSALLSKHENNYSKSGYEEIKARYKGYLDKQLRLIKRDALIAKNAFSKDALLKSTALADSIINDLDMLLGSADLGVLKEYNGFSLRMDFDRKLTEGQQEYKALLNDCKARLNGVIERFRECYLLDPCDDNALAEYYSDTENFIKVLNEFDKNYTKAKREENLLDFNDLERFTLEILSDEQIAEDIRGKYKYVFVDECQDTNGVQDKIISTISNNNLFMVGDVKQSIYGFRGCRPEIFAKKSAQMEEEGQTVVRLNDNFRSAKAVVDTVNSIFDFCMTEEFFGEEYSQTSRLKFGGVYPETANGRTEFSYLHTAAKKKNEEVPRVYDLLDDKGAEFDEQTASVASLVTEIINDELGKTYYDAKEKKEKQVKYGDITILTRSRKSQYVQNLVKGLKRHGIPVASEVRENVCDYPEIAMLVNALKLIDCFCSDIPLVSTLRGPIGNFTDEELMDVALFFQKLENKERDKSSGFYQAFEYYLKNADTPLKDRLKEFKTYVDELRFLSDFIGARGVLQKLVLDKDLEGCFYAQRNGKAKVGRLRRFISATSDGGRVLPVKEFLAKTEDSAEAFGFTDSVEEDTVRLMTIHASKGLEFPVVIVCGLEKVLNNSEENEPILFSREFGFALKGFDDKDRMSRETVLRGLIKEMVAEERVREEMRLFYVATTRATYSLRLTYCGKKENRSLVFSGADRFMDFIPKKLPITVLEEEQLSFSDLSRGTRKVLIANPDTDAEGRMREAFAYRYPHLLDTALPLKTSVTKANEQAKDEDAPKTVVLFDEQDTSKELGITAHKILELYDFGNTKTFEEQVEQMLQSGQLLAEEVARLDLTRIKDALNDKVFDGLKESELYREKNFLVQVPARLVMDVDTDEPVLVQGVIDLLCIDKDGAKIIDYKYSRHSANALISRYKKQLDLYAYAVEKVLGVPIKERRLVNLYTGQTVKI